MFALKTFPNVTDEFLSAYRFSEIISQRYTIGGSYIASDLPYPSVLKADLKIPNLIVGMMLVSLAAYLVVCFTLGTELQ